jgi:hypothetical protein
MSPRHWGLLQFGHVLAMRIHVLAGSDRWRVPGGIKRLADTALVARSGTVGGALQLPRAGARAERDEQHDDVGAVTGLRTCPSAGLAAGDLADGDLAARGAGAHRDMASRLVRDRPFAAESARNCARGNLSVASDVRDLDQGFCLIASVIETLRFDSMLDAGGGRHNGMVSILFGNSRPAWQGDEREPAGP